MVIANNNTTLNIKTTKCLQQTYVSYVGYCGVIVNCLIFYLIHAQPEYYMPQSLCANMD